MKIYAHRGWKAGGHIENSAEAIRSALLKGHHVEIDLHLLGDETLICSHDPHIGPPYLPTRIPIKSLDLEGVRQLRCKETGSSIALLSNIATWMVDYPDSHVFWEIKHGGEPMSQRLLEVIKSFSLEGRVTVIGYRRERNISSALGTLAKEGIKVGLIGAPLGLFRDAKIYGASLLLTGYTEWWEEILFRSLVPLFLP